MQYEEHLRTRILIIEDNTGHIIQVEFLLSFTIAGSQINYNLKRNITFYLAALRTGGAMELI